jgi:hypothetical protein
MGSIPRRLIAVALGCVGACALDALVFRTHFYLSNLDPSSAAGTFEMILWREQRAQKALGDNVVVTLGDSRFSLIPKLSNALVSETGYIYRTAGVAGSDARAWYYMLRDLDPAANRYRAIVFGVNDYKDEDVPVEPDQDIRALYFAAARLRPTDALDFARSFPGFELQLRALRAAIFKGVAYQNDFHEFLVNPRKRIRDVRFQRSGHEQWTYDFLGVDGSMAGLSIDWPTLIAHYPASMDAAQRATVEAFLLWKPEAQSGRLAAFRRLWFGRILDRYRNSRTKIIFLRLPRGPIPRPEDLAGNPGSVIREFASRPNVLLMDEHFFEPLEKPELFRDALHMNKSADAIFSAMLAREIARMIGPPR